MNDQKNKWVWIGVAVVAIVVVVGIIVWFINQGKTPPQGPVPVHAPTGQVVTGFPQELILGTATSSQTASSGAESFFAGITNSYSINYSSSTNQYTAEWVSSSTPAALYAQYQSYIAKNGWTVTNHADYPTMKGIYASNASSSASVNIVITPQSKSAASKGSKVTVSYVSAAQVGQ